ncbi:MAG: hypothetical protein QXE10_01695 [Desulfurococcaceae archaeon]
MFSAMKHAGLSSRGLRGSSGLRRPLKHWALRGAPCTGTHVKNTGEAGKIRMLRLEKHLRGFKLTYNVE